MTVVLVAGTFYVYGFFGILLLALIPLSFGILIARVLRIDPGWNAAGITRTP